MRSIDQQRLAAQLDFLNRITRGGEIDPELAYRERLALAARVSEKRGVFLKWMKLKGFTQDAINIELRRLDMVVAELTKDPSKPVMSEMRGLIGSL